MAIGLGTLGDYTPSSGNSLTLQPRVSSALLFSGGDSVSVAKPKTAVAVVLAPAQLPADCGPEPARKQVGPSTVYVDPATGKAWQDCRQRLNDAAAAKAYAAIDAAPDCGPEPPFAINQAGNKIYQSVKDSTGADLVNGGDLGAYWNACRAKRQTAQTTSPAVVPGKTLAVPPTLTSSPSSSTPTPQQAAPSLSESVATVGPALAMALGPSSSVKAGAGGDFGSPRLDAAETAAKVGLAAVALAGLVWLVTRKR